METSESPELTSAPVVFDLFHTLIDPDDFRPRGFRRLEAAAAVLGVSPAVLSAEWDRSLPRIVRGSDSVRGLMRRVAHDNGRPARTMDIAPAAEAMGRYQDLALLHPRRAIVDLMKELDRRPVGVLTNCHDRDIEAWGRSPISKLVDAVAFSTKIGAAKPESDAYRAIVEMLDETAAECIYVGNGGDDELAGAAAAGFGHIVHFTWFDDAAMRTSPSERARRSAFASTTAARPEELRAAIGLVH